MRMEVVAKRVTIKDDCTRLVHVYNGTRAHWVVKLPDIGYKNIRGTIVDGTFVPATDEGRALVDLYEPKYRGWKHGGYKINIDETKQREANRRYYERRRAERSDQ